MNTNMQERDRVNVAIENALLQANFNDLILVCGSIFLVGEIGLFDFMKM